MAAADPVVAAFLREGAYAPLLDWLDDKDATLADLACIYAGTPPVHEDGLPQEWLATWFDLHQQPVAAVAVRGVGEDVQLFVRTVAADAVLTRLLLEEATEAAVYGRASPGLSGTHPAVVEASRKAKAVVRRDQKGRTLALPVFADLRLVRVHHVDAWTLQTSRTSPVRFILERLLAEEFDPDRAVLSEYVPQRSHVRVEQPFPAQCLVPWREGRSLEQQLRQAVQSWDSLLELVLSLTN